MGETVEARAAVVGAHAAVAQAAEGKVFPHHVRDSVVKGNAAGACRAQHTFLRRATLGEEVERQRRRSVAQQR